MNQIDKAIQLIKEASSVVILTGAGASTESGIPDFRSSGNAEKSFSKYHCSVEMLLSHRFFLKHTDIFYDYYKNNLVIKEARPNDCHKALAALEKLCNLRAVITQNIDGFHQEAGSTNVIELHGTTKRYFCMKCTKQFSVDDIMASKQLVPLCDHCGGIIKPDVVLYEEPLNEKDLTTAVNLTLEADALIVIGTSLVVHPAAGLLDYYRSDKLILVNLSSTPFDNRADVVIHEKAGSVMKSIADGLKTQQ